MRCRTLRRLLFSSKFLWRVRWPLLHRYARSCSLVASLNRMWMYGDRGWFPLIICAPCMSQCAETREKRRGRWCQRASGATSSLWISAVRAASRLTNRRVITRMPQAYKRIVRSNQNCDRTKSWTLKNKRDRVRVEVWECSLKSKIESRRDKSEVKLLFSCRVFIHLLTIFRVWNRLGFFVFAVNVLAFLTRRSVVPPATQR